MPMLPGQQPDDAKHALQANTSKLFKLLTFNYLKSFKAKRGEPIKLHQALYPWSMKIFDTPNIRLEPASFEALDKLLGELDSRGISIKGLRLLIYLRAAGSDLKRLNVLASAIGLTSAGLTGVADQLERRGLAARVFQRQDRRSIYLTLTPKGIQFVDWLAECLGETAGKAAS